ncbi:MAG: hypothetical protein VB124_02065, partial [Burkholderia sp.]
IQSRMASRKTGLQVTPRSPSGSALATCRLIAKSCLKNRIRYTSAARNRPMRRRIDGRRLAIGAPAAARGHSGRSVAPIR